MMARGLFGGASVGLFDIDVLTCFVFPIGLEFGVDRSIELTRNVVGDVEDLFGSVVACGRGGP